MPVPRLLPPGFHSSSRGQGSDHKQGRKPISEGSRVPKRRTPVEGRQAPPGPREDLSAEGNFSCDVKDEEALAGAGGGVPDGQQEGPACSRNLRRATMLPARASCLSRPLSWPLCHPPASRRSWWETRSQQTILQMWRARLGAAALAVSEPWEEGVGTPEQTRQPRSRKESFNA